MPSYKVMHSPFFCIENRLWLEVELLLDSLQRVSWYFPHTMDFLEQSGLLETTSDTEVRLPAGTAPAPACEAFI